MLFAQMYQSEAVNGFDIGNMGIAYTSINNLNFMLASLLDSLTRRIGLIFFGELTLFVFLWCSGHSMPPLSSGYWRTSKHFL
jgi:hypothetical protein